MMAAIILSGAAASGLVVLLAARACARFGFSSGFNSGWDAGRQALRDEAERVMLERRHLEQTRRNAIATQLRPEDRAN